VLAESPRCSGELPKSPFFFCILLQKFISGDFCHAFSGRGGKNLYKTPFFSVNTEKNKGYPLLIFDKKEFFSFLLFYSTTNGSKNQIQIS